MATYKTVRTVGAQWNLPKLKAELLAAYGVNLSVNISTTDDGGYLLTVEYNPPITEDMVDRIVTQHLATTAFSVIMPDVTRPDSPGAMTANRAGSFAYGTGTIEDISTIAAGGATGVFGGYPPTEYPVGSGQYWVYMVLNNGTLQYAISAPNATNGVKVYAGNGAVALDASGVTLAMGTGAVNQIKWQDAGTTFTTHYVANPGGGTPNRGVIYYMTANAEAGGTGYAAYSLRAYDGGTGQAGLLFGTNDDYTLTRASPTQSLLLNTNSNSGSYKIKYGDYTASFSTAINVLVGAPVTLATRTVQSNSMGTTGKHVSRLQAIVLNDSAGTRTHAFQYNFGSYSFTLTASATVAASATNHSRWMMEVVTYNLGATNSQVHFGKVWREDTAAADTAGNWDEDKVWWGTSAIDTTANVTVTFKAYSSANTATQTAKGVAEFEGPYY